MTNPITTEIREARRRLADKFDNDLDRIVDDLQRKQRESGRRYSDRSKSAHSAVVQYGSNAEQQNESRSAAVDGDG
ncbi:MAG: hypothetical protein AAGA92_05990 [Planctomycetota bacterium]